MKRKKASQRPPGPYLLTHHPIPIAHKFIRRMIAVHRRDAVAARFGAGDAAVSVVIVERRRIALLLPSFRRRRGGRRRRLPGCGLGGGNDLQGDRRAGLKHGQHRLRLAGVYRQAERRLTATTRFTYQHLFSSGSHSATSLPPFWSRFRSGEAKVRLSGPLANARRVKRFAAS